jgi:hypothetical protein
MSKSCNTSPPSHLHGVAGQLYFSLSLSSGQDPSISLKQWVELRLKRFVHHCFLNASLMTLAFINATLSLTVKTRYT